MFEREVHFHCQFPFLDLYLRLRYRPNILPIGERQTKEEGNFR